MAAKKAPARFQRVTGETERGGGGEGAGGGAAECEAKTERSPEARSFRPGRPRFRDGRSEGSAECDDVTGLLGDARSVCVKRTRSGIDPFRIRRRIPRPRRTVKCATCGR